MKLVRYGAEGCERPGMLDGQGGLRDLSGLLRDIDPQAMVRGLQDSLGAVDAERLPRIDGTPRLGPPLARPGKIIAIGLNYVDHAKESGMAIPAEPVVFMKAPSTLSGPYDDVPKPAKAEKMDWEVELGIVIGKSCRDVSERDAAGNIFGYVLANDLSDRAFQLDRGGQWDKGKSFDRFCPVGPYLVTRDEIADVHALDIWLSVDGERVQQSNTRQMIFNCPAIVSYLSQCMTLEPGDLVITGTPAGVGLGMKPPRYLRGGELIELGIAGLGTQKYRITC
ncbi:2-hydroxyhepta-2,4-diene-1,7-dioate isomerase [Pigmentiphaga sp. NML030171]|uniref:fumarylacetoacetate hydrolase family protein n=1 Tax=Pigmentiphaga sp. NML030171 TaxID=2008676 RepID=UPI000B418E4D|nr:fumarylacetoacetate hydrolase family protein [Pigmentiphaga sp. NML030171]OVZ62256.1 2-hydroxyhepta-2,4-diene-1,7-dioate isomerase [Pigmentiphaga sp. NML030171]